MQKKKIARHKILPRSLQHAVLIPVTTGLLHLFLPSCNEDNIASDTKTTCFDIVEGILFNR